MGEHEAPCANLATTAPRGAVRCNALFGGLWSAYVRRHLLGMIWTILCPGLRPCEATVRREGDTEAPGSNEPCVCPPLKALSIAMPDKEPRLVLSEELHHIGPRHALLQLAHDLDDRCPVGGIHPSRAAFREDTQRHQADSDANKWMASPPVDVRDSPRQGHLASRFALVLMSAEHRVKLRRGAPQLAMAHEAAAAVQLRGRRERRQLQRVVLRRCMRHCLATRPVLQGPERQRRGHDLKTWLERRHSGNVDLEAPTSA